MIEQNYEIEGSRFGAIRYQASPDDTVGSGGKGDGRGPSRRPQPPGKAESETPPEDKKDPKTE